MENNKKERRRGIVRVRGGFSDITGIFPRNNTIQLEEFDDDTRTKISNKLYEIFEMDLIKVLCFDNACLE